MFDLGKRTGDSWMKQYKSLALTKFLGAILGRRRIVSLNLRFKKIKPARKRVVCSAGQAYLVFCKINVDFGHNRAIMKNVIGKGC